MISTIVEQTIINDYLSNMDIQTLCEKYNASEREIRTILKRENVDRGYNKFSRELIDRIIYLYTHK
jgi:Mor family transcriptional regulator